MKKAKLVIILSIFIFLLSWAPLALAHGGEDHQTVETQAIGEETDYTIPIMVISSIIIMLAVLAAIFIKEKSEFLKYVLFAMIVVPAVGVTLFMTATTIYKNVTSESGGPIHWHADFEIWVCDSQKDLVNPQGFSNKVGTSVFHEHGDNRIHVEGVVADNSQITLGEFFGVVGGEVHSNHINIPTVHGQSEISNGKYCATGPGEVQVFVYKTEGDQYYQQKLTDPENYLLTPEASVPPGDCIIIEFSVLEKEKTDKLCDQYQLKERLGEIHAR